MAESIWIQEERRAKPVQQLEVFVWQIAPRTIEEHQRYEGHHGSDDTKGDWEGYFLGSFNSRLGWIHPSA